MVRRDLPASLMARILYVESHYQGAHRDWIDGFVAHSAHDFTLLTMPGGDWRWRLHSGALHLAAQFNQHRETLPRPDVLLINGMANAVLFLAATRPHLMNIPVALYIQENQLDYPAEGEGNTWQDGAVVQALSAYVADRIFFNGQYLEQDFLNALQRFVAEHDYTADWVERVQARTGVLRRGIRLSERFGPPPPRRPPNGPLTFLWSHRWAYEKGVHDFAAALRQLHAEDIPFRVILAGNPWNNETLRDELITLLGERVVAHGMLKGEAYAEALRQADVMVACSLNEPLGVSMLEAIYVGCLPVLPRRGSFPVMLPPQAQDLLYDGTREALIARLRDLALNPQTAVRPGLWEVAAAYDWPVVRAEYDAAIEALIQYRV
ncbi:MAG: DUF3524 domain-containing protein [Anaerolineales bacterium]